MLERFSIRQVILGALGALALVTSVGALGLLLTAASMRRELERRTAQLVEDEAIAAQIVTHVERQLDAVHAFTAAPDSTLPARFRAEGMLVYDQLRSYLFRALDPAERRLVERIREQHELIDIHAQRVFAGDVSTASASEPSVAPGADVGSLRAQLAELIRLRRQAVLRLVREQRSTWLWLYAAGALIGALFLTTIVFVTRFLQRRLLAPLHALSHSAARVGAGDFAVRIDASSGDELGSVADSFNRMTARLRAAVDELRSSHQRYQQLFDGVPVGLYRSTPDGRLLDANDAALHLLGFSSRQELLDRQLGQLYEDPADRTRWQEALAHADGIVEVDQRHRRADGSVVWLRDTARAVRDDAGAVLYYEGALQDVTERVRAAETVRRSEARFRSLIENASDGVLIIDAAGNVQYQSPAIERMLGYTPAETLGTDAFALVHDEDRSFVRTAFTGLIAPGDTHAVEFRARHRNGGWRLLHSIGTNLLDDPAVGGLVINMIDRTAQRQLEEQLQHAQKMEAVGRLAGGVAHDFNNLLTAIQGYSDLLLDRVGSDADAAAELAEIRRAAERAAALTRQLLAFSRRQIARPRATRVDLVVTELEHMLRRLLTEDVPLRTRTAQPCWVNIDTGQLEQIIMNLVVNARDAAPRHIDVVVERITSGVAHPAKVTPGEYVRIDVIDDGSGIEPDVLPFIFEPFFTTKDVGHGTGLGLATVYGIVHQSGGHVLVESEPGRGATFTVLLPAIDSPEPQQPASPPALPRAGSETVLLVEDEAAVRALAERILRRNGYNVLAAANGLDALDLVGSSARAIDIVVTDVVMPAMGGFALAERLLRDNPDLPVLFMSGYTADTIGTTDPLGRPLHLLEKPFSPGVFARTIRGLLDGRVTRAHG